MPRILVTVGEPAGIGPDVLLQIAKEPWDGELIVVGDPELLHARAKQLQIPITLIETDLNDSPRSHQKNLLPIFPVKLQAPCIPGQLNPKNASYVIECLTLATEFCLRKKADALLTGPIQKSILNEAGIPFVGHTEFLADYCKTPHVVMLFVVNALRVALLTTHLPLAEVPKAITKEAILQTITILYDSLKTQFGIATPKILVSGLNPHAGEGGYLGREEIDIITPALNELRNKNISLEGPLPADTIFTEKHLQSADMILAMYHDQALPVVKYLGFHDAVNVTLGLPIIRTSVDHGTALDIAGTNRADPGSLRSAIRLTIALIQHSRNTI